MCMWCMYITSANSRARFARVQHFRAHTRARAKRAFFRGSSNAWIALSFCRRKNQQCDLGLVTMSSGWFVIYVCTKGTGRYSISYFSCSIYSYICRLFFVLSFFVGTTKDSVRQMRLLTLGQNQMTEFHVSLLLRIFSSY